VELVYEDQGPPFVLEAGDCVLQPPLIRHRVLEASPGLEVIEIASPASHLTSADHELPLPNARIAPDRDFDGQRFVRHRANDATWTPWGSTGFEATELGLEDATSGLARVRRVRSLGQIGRDVDLGHHAEFAFWYVLEGTLRLRVDGAADQELGPDDCMTIPAGMDARITSSSAGLDVLEVVVP
jgi:mannose-6-phosphate isomerase-like protein (cupin superfamily)